MYIGNLLSVGAVGIKLKRCGSPYSCKGLWPWYALGRPNFQKTVFSDSFRADLHADAHVVFVLRVGELKIGVLWEEANVLATDGALEGL
jgi:hypothetical protein